MGTISTGIGLISGINTATLIEQLLALEGRGKLALQQRVAGLQARKTAMLDINARLLNLKSAARSFRRDRTFQAALATSSNDEVLTATATGSAIPGTYQFIVHQRAAASQLLSRGFASATGLPIGLSTLSLELGRGRLQTDSELASLNGGEGVDRGTIVITDRAGGSATVDLRTAATISEVIEFINNAAGISVTASVSGDRLVVTDDSGGGGTLIIANGSGSTTATDLGLAATDGGAGDADGAANGVLTGSAINTLGESTALDRLNDGNGVLIRNGTTDFTITARDGTVLSIDLGRIDADITGATRLEDLNDGAGVTIGDDENTDFSIIARDGTQHDISLNGVTTVTGLMTRINNATGGDVTIALVAGENKFRLTDTTGGAGRLRVIGAGENGTQTAEDLGLLNVTGVLANTLDGETLLNADFDPAASTIGDVIDRVTGATGNGGKIVASIGADGVSLLITDTTGGAGNLIIRSSAASNPTVAADLGIETGAAGVAADTVAGSRLIAGLNSVLVARLNGGAALSGGTTLTITDRSGASDTITISESGSIADIIAKINASAIGVTAGLNAAGNGLAITDSTGGAGNLIIAGTAAAPLGLATGAGGVAASSVRGGSLQHQSVAEASRLRDLNYGRGVGTGSFRIFDGFGGSEVVEIGSDSTTLYDVIAEINSRGLKLSARINDTGDGLLIEHDYDPMTDGEPAAALRVEAVSGTTARDLGILGSADDAASSLDGSYEKTVDLTETDTLSEVVEAINRAGIPVTASILNTGAGPAPYRITFSSTISGRAGDLLIDSGDFDLGLTTLTQAADARVFYGSDDPASAVLLSSSTNQLRDIVPGLTLDLHAADDEPVSVTVERDTTAIVDAVQRFVTTLNDALARIAQYDRYDVDTEEKGPLLGDPTAAQTRAALYRTLQRRAMGVETQYQYLSQVGIRLGSSGTVDFDQSKFEAAYAADPDAVEKLFAAYEASASVAEEIAPGVTVTSDALNYTSLGLAELFDQLLDDLTSSIDGTLPRVDGNLQRLIDSTSERIEQFDQRLEARRVQLQAQFAAMEAVLAQLQVQNNSLVSLAGNITLAQGVRS
jgi:flagellar hook-associated protein 2